ncbi:hypothetical protein [Paraburkholderia tropica]|uniref:hypothetical protein n=1 Tax=Paraburkholderia tropica TaxID=92647 RepID=UPI002AB79A6A|nr:hypothetical protein [Paraburkholderia tropica]
MDIIEVICIVVLTAVSLGAIAIGVGKLLAHRRERDSEALDWAAYSAIQPLSNDSAEPYPRAWE